VFLDVGAKETELFAKNIAIILCIVGIIVMVASFTRRRILLIETCLCQILVYACFDT